MRCSSLPLLMLCPGAGRTDDGGVLIDSHIDAADDGTDVHRLLAGWPDGDAPKLLVDELSDDARINYYSGAKMWRDVISAWMPGSVAEVALSDGELIGHVDRRSLVTSRREVVILDWKTGRRDVSRKHQGFGYARLELGDLFPEDIDRATVHFAWTRTQELESYTVSRTRAGEWNRERIERIERWDGKFTTGEHCAHCPRKTTCPAHRQLARMSVDAISGPSLPDLALMTAPEVVTFHERLKVLESLLKAAQSSLRREVESRGEVLSDDGRVLHLVDENGPREVDTLKAWPVLNRALDAEELGPCLKVKLGDVEEAVAAKAGRGHGAAAKRLLAEELKAAGAVTQGKQKKLRLERIK